MKAYLCFFRMRLVNGLQYRTAAWAGVFTQFFWGFMEIQLYRAFYAANPEAFPMAFSQLTGYIWLRQAFLALLNTWSFEHELVDAVVSGSVAYELCRPVSLYGMWLARTLALLISRAALRCMPILIVAALLPEPYGLRFAASAGAFAGFIVSLALATAVNGAMRMIVYFSCFYTVSANGLPALLIPIQELLSGSVIPLPFMPDALAKLCALMPFAAIVNVPLRIYTGSLAGADAVTAMTLQVFWLAALTAAGLALQRRGMRRLCVQGG